MTGKQLEKARWLNRAFHAEKLAEALQSKAERDRSLAEHLSKCPDSFGGNPSGNSTESVLFRLAETEEKLHVNLTKLVDLREKINAAIESVEDMEL